MFPLYRKLIHMKEVMRKQYIILRLRKSIHGNPFKTQIEHGCIQGGGAEDSVQRRGDCLKKD